MDEIHVITHVFYLHSHIYLHSPFVGFRGAISLHILTAMYQCVLSTSIIEQDMLDLVLHLPIHSFCEEVSNQLAMSWLMPYFAGPTVFKADCTSDSVRLTGGLLVRGGDAPTRGPDANGLLLPLSSC